MDDHDGTVRVLAMSPSTAILVGLGPRTSANEVCLYHISKECWLAGH